MLFIVPGCKSALSLPGIVTRPLFSLILELLMAGATRNLLPRAVVSAARFSIPILAAPQTPPSLSRIPPPQRLGRHFRLMRDHFEKRARRCVGFAASLFPVAQGAERNPVALGKLLERESQRPPDDLDAGGA